MRRPVRQQITKPTTIGQMRERITVQRATRTPDGIGGGATTWADVYTLPARAQAIRGAEGVSGGRLVTVETYLFVIRFGPTITTRDRIVWSGRYWNITSVADRENRRQYLTIEATAGDDGAY
jgi:SPP1 family predicted phage head-tail adaptor